jgi:hypothetical protein
MSDAEQARLAALLAGDWTTAFDDLLCQRLPRCTLCGTGQPAYFDIATLDDGLCVAYRLCAPCHRQDPTLEQVSTLLQRRYRDQGE